MAIEYASDINSLYTRLNAARSRQLLPALSDSVAVNSLGLSSQMKLFKQRLEQTASDSAFMLPATYNIGPIEIGDLMSQATLSFAGQVIDNMNTACINYSNCTSNYSSYQTCSYNSSDDSSDNSNNSRDTSNNSRNSSAFTSRSDIPSGEHTSAGRSQDSNDGQRTDCSNNSSDCSGDNSGDYSRRTNYSSDRSNRSAYNSGYVPL